MSDAATADTSCPTSDIDPFSDAFLSDPYPFHEELRELGPVVYLERYGIWSMARHEHVHASLTDWETFISSAGVGLDDFRKVTPWRPKSIVLEVDPPLHDKNRGVMARILSPQAMREIRPHFEAKAGELVDQLIARGQFDAIPDLAEAYPLMVFPDAMGVQREGREHLLAFSTMVFNSFGPQNDIYKSSLAAAEPALEWILEQCSRERLTPDGFGARVFEHMDAGDLTEEEAPIIVRSFLTAGLDTTVNGLGSAILAFASNPDQWQALRQDPSLIKPAFDEILRWESPVQTFFRTASKDVEVGGTVIPEDAKVLLFLGAANRDPRKWPDPERFDISRRPVGHVAFGTGIHRCVGQLLARLEADVLLGALIERVDRFELAGPPVRKLNNTLRALESLRVEAVPL